jgi:light-regulated signal transduction histidine kinase (bacteriophytochrome)
MRAPLRHIKALSLFINEDYGDKLDEKGKEFISNIGTTCDDAETMINELLKLAR